MERPTRIVFYTDAPLRGGAEISLGHLVREIGDDFEITLMGVDDTVLAALEAERPGVEVVRVPDVRNKADMRGFLAHRRAIARLRPAIFHANLRTMSACQYALLAALSVRGVRSIAVEQLPMIPETVLSTVLKRYTSRRLAAHVAVGSRAARLVEAASGGQPGRVRTIYNGVPEVDVDAGSRAPVEGLPLVGCASRLDVIKGLDVLLDVAAGRPEMRVMLVGDGPERGRLEEQVERLGLGDRVELTGWVEDPRALIASFDVFVLPSRLEGFPLSIVEAMLAGVPVVATDVGSVGEAIDSETGRLVPAGDRVALAGALGELVADADLRARLGHAGRRRARERFTSEAMVRSFETLYREVLDL